MDCADAESALVRLFDDEPEGGVGRALWLHLAACANCRELLVDLLLVRALCRVVGGEWDKEKCGRVE